MIRQLLLKSNQPNNHMDKNQLLTLNLPIMAITVYLCCFNKEPDTVKVAFGGSNMESSSSVIIAFIQILALQEHTKGETNLKIQILFLVKQVAYFFIVSKSPLEAANSNVTILRPFCSYIGKRGSDFFSACLRLSKRWKLYFATSS